MPLVPKLDVYRRRGWLKPILIRIAVIGLGIYLGALFFQGYLVYSIRVHTNAMNPSIQSGDFLVVTPVLYGRRSLFSNRSYLDFAGPARGELVVLDPPYVENHGFFYNWWNRTVELFTLGRYHAYGSWNDSQAWTQAPVVRRVIGVPGDTIRYHDGLFQIKPKGAQQFVGEFALINRPYQTTKPAVSDETLGPVEVTVPEATYYVASDDRNDALDSRRWGPVEAADLKGLVLLRYWPREHAGAIQ